ncbi:MAG TPA: hypothetical protein PLG18_11250, partial [Syntrophales bacterium]|nr:hypothetical protein [Syntrophales bacterium]
GKKYKAFNPACKEILTEIVDPNAVLPGPAAFECFKAIPGRYPQIIQPVGDLELSEFPSCHRCDTSKPSHADSLREGFGFGRLG